MIDVAALAFLDPPPVPCAAPGPARVVIEDAATREARLPRGPGQAWRVAGGARPRACWFHGLRRGGFVCVAHRARLRWSSVELVVPAEEVFADYAAALDGFRRRRAERQPAAGVSA